MCKICDSGFLGYVWTVDVKNKKRTIKEMCEFFNVTRQEAWEHIQNHNIESHEGYDIEEFDESAIDYYMKFKKMLKTLEEWIDYITSTNQPDRNTISSLTQLIKEYRQALMNLAEIEGKIKRGQVVVEIEEYNKKLDEIVETIMTVLCDDCRVKVFEKLEVTLNV